MKLPANIKGRKKIRDAKILLSWGVDHEDTATIAQKFNLKERRILQILRANHKALPIDKEWEKLKRIERLQRWIKKKPVTFKDPVDIQEQLRKEIEGDKPLITVQQNVALKTYGWRNESHHRALRTTTISDGDTQQSSEISSS